MTQMLNLAGKDVKRLFLAVIRNIFRDLKQDMWS